MVNFNEPMTLFDLLSLFFAIIGFGLILWQLMDLKATRHGELVKTIFEWWNTEEMYKAYIRTKRLKFKSWDAFKKRNPEGSDGWRSWMMTVNFFNTVGILVRTKALDKKVAHMILKNLPRLWTNLEPLVNGYRREFASPQFAREFEGLYQTY